MMDTRAAKLALARQKLKNHQEKKLNHKVEDHLEDHRNESHSANQHQLSEVVADEKEVGTVSNENSSENSSTKISKDIHDSQGMDEVNVTEILMSNKRNLELQVSELLTKLGQTENSYAMAMNSNHFYKQQMKQFDCEFKILQDKYLRITDEILSKDAVIAELNHINYSVSEENNNLQEQLEFTKSILTTKESENASLHNEINNLQRQLDATQLQLQQLTNGYQAQSPDQNGHPKSEHNTDELLQKISNLELKIKTLQKEKDQISSHYDHYVAEINEQLKLAIARNQELATEVQNLSVRESNLIEQISEMEIRIQHFKQQEPQTVQEDDKITNEINDLQQQYKHLEVKFQNLNLAHEHLQKQYSESEAKVKELSEANANQTDHNISLTKLNADIESDKLAAQRATEQNRKLKMDLQELEEAFVKISQDKLELTEKVAAEKYLNRELTIKLAEIEEKAKETHTKLFAKDEEMIRLQNKCREVERMVEKQSEDKSSRPVTKDSEEHVCNSHSTINENNSETGINSLGEENNGALEMSLNKDEHNCYLKNDTLNNDKIPKEDAMIKLQERFLKIMGEVADLSDEKHRLEHIILQLQNETDTICEYVALYQQQRSLLKKRDEERSAQVKIFQAECDRLKSQLEELSKIIVRLANDTELAVLFKVEPHQSDLVKVMNLLSNLKSNTLIDPQRTSSELSNFYPCSCCSGKLIDV